MKSTTLGLVAAGVLALTANGASAEIVCNDEGECWHVKERVEYRPEFKLHVHEDSWKWKEHENYKWREHEGHGHGYWNRGAWIDIH